MSSAPQPGTVLAGKYRVEEVLGVGGMGIVVAAYHLQLDQKVAIKYLLPEAFRNPEVVERFSREARAAAKIRGEHVARVIDVGQFDDGSPYMIMEYLEGQDLGKELATKAPLRIEDVIRYILETCEALAEAHAARIVHRDLKPQNLFLALRPGKRSMIKVLDFGISKVGSDAQSAALTRTSALMGTAFYMSPEQLTTPKLVDHRSDIWSLGVILYELLTGTPPFMGENVAEIIAGILTNEPEPLRARRPEVPEGLANVIASCMRSKPVDRHPSVAALAAALAPFALPADRRSAEITARVLGESEPALDPTPPLVTETLATNTLPARITPVSGGPLPGGPGAPTALPAGGVPSAGQAAPMSATPQSTQHYPHPASRGADPRTPASYAPTEVGAVVPRAPEPGSVQPAGVLPVTTHALSRSSSGLEQQRSKTPLVAFALVAGILAVGGVGYALKQFASGKAPPSEGIVSAPASTGSSPAPPATGGGLKVEEPPPSTAAAAPSTATSEAPAATGAATHAASPAAPAGHGPATATSAKRNPAQPPASVAVVPHAPPPSAATSPAPAPTPSSTAAKNPLNMGIK